MISWLGSEAMIRTRLFAFTLRVCLVPMTIPLPGRGSSSGRADRAARDELIWEESLVSWDDEAALRECRVPLLYMTPALHADLARAVELCPGLMIARTIGSGHPAHSWFRSRSMPCSSASSASHLAG